MEYRINNRPLKKEVCCPYCDQIFGKIHSVYQRDIQDMISDSGQEHTADSNDSFLVTTACFYTLVAIGYFWVFLRTQ